MPRRAIPAIVAMTLAPIWPAFAADETPATRTTVYAGVEIGNTDSRRFDAGASVRLRDAWGASVALARANVELPDSRTQSTLFSTRISYDFGKFGVGLGFRHGEIEEASRSRGWFASGSYEHRELRFGLEVESRQSTFEPAAFTEELGGAIGLVSGTSHCAVDGLGYQARVDWDRPTWSAYGSLRVFDYDDYDCALDITGPGAPPANGPPPHARGRALGRRLAAAGIGQIGGATSRLVPRETALLESSAALGLTLPISGQWIGGGDIYRDVERLDGSDYLTGLVFAGTRLGDTWAVELSLGYSTADLIDDTAFAGVRFTASLQ
jgi:hypothetical protein